MNKIFAGLLLVFLNFDITLGASKIGLIPDFLGYIFMLRGTAEILTYSPRFGRVRPHIIAMTVYTSLIYAADLLGLTATGGTEFIGIIVGIIAFGFALYISYQIVRGIMDIEEARQWDLGGRQLLTVWKIRAVILILLYLLIFVPALAFVAMLVGLATSICFLVVFNTTRKQFYAQHPQ